MRRSPVALKVQVSVGEWGAVLTVTMWKLTTCYDSNGDPLLTSRNEHTGRQVWVYDAAAGSSEERAIVEGLRDEFTKNRLQQRHSSDELLRLQKVVKEKVSSLHLQLAVERCKDEQVSLSCAQIVPPPTAPPQDGECPKDEHVRGHLESGIAFHSMLQMDDGHFPGDYGGPMFLMPGMLISCYVTGVLNTVMSPQHKTEMIRYLKNHQNEDGGFGLHIEGHSTMFGTGLRSALMRISHRKLQNCFHPSSQFTYMAFTCCNVQLRGIEDLGYSCGRSVHRKSSLMGALVACKQVCGCLLVMPRNVLLNLPKFHFLCCKTTSSCREQFLTIRNTASAHL